MQAFRCDVVAIFMAIFVAIFACAIAVASSASAYGVQDAGHFAPSPTQSTVESEEVLECLRAGHGPIGIPVMSLSIPRQTAQADLVRWCRLLEVDPSFSSRLKSALERACARDDAFRLNRFPAAFELAASVARPAESMSADQVARLSTDIASTRRRILSDMLALERESMRSALSEDEASAVELEVLDAIGHLRMIELVNDSVATPEVAKVSIGRLLDVHGPRILSEQSLAVARAIYGDSLAEIAGLARTHQLALGRAIGAGARFSVAAGARRAGGAVSVDKLEEWRTELASTRRAVARAGERMFEAKQTAVDSICRALPDEEATRLRAQFNRMVFGPFAVDVWDARSLICAHFGANTEPADGLQPLLDEYAHACEATLGELQRECVRSQVFEAAASNVGREERSRTRERLVGLQRRSRDQASLILEQIYALEGSVSRDAWSAAVEQFRAAAEDAAVKQLDALNPLE